MHIEVTARKRPALPIFSSVLCIIWQPTGVPWYSTNQRLVYQSVYPGTALAKRLSEAKGTNQRTLVQYQPAFGVPISVPWYSPAKTTVGGETYQSAYPGTVPISVWCTNQCTLVQPCQNNPLRQNVPFGVPWYSINQRLVYQSAYPGTALPKRHLEAKRINRRTLVQEHCYLHSTCVLF